MMGATDLEIRAICDVYEPHQKSAATYARVSNAGVEVMPGGLTSAQKKRVLAAYAPATYYDYREMLEKEKLDAVVVATPLYAHFQPTMDALDAGCHVFCEKTMCYSVDQARQIVQKCHDKDRFVQVGHQRRYNPLYNKAAMMIREGTIGRLVHVDAQWHRNNDWRRPWDKSYKLNPEESKYIQDLGKHLNWRLYNDTSHGLMTELATHQLDVGSWFLDTMPVRVCGIWGREYWRDGRECEDEVNLVFDYEVSKESRGFSYIQARNAYQDKEAINSTYNVRFCYSSITSNAKKGCSELFEGDKGTIELTETGGSMFEEPTASVKWGSGGSTGGGAEASAKVITSGGTLSLSNKEVTAGEPITVENDQSVDQLQFIRFAHDIKNGGVPKANQMVGLRATVMAMAGWEAMNENKIVEIDPALYTFDFETPDPSVIS